MQLEKALASFDEKLVVPLFADITRTLEVTCHNSGEENHGSNFVGNAVVLSGIETVAQFTDSTTLEEAEKYQREAKASYRSLPSEVRKHVSPRYTPGDGSYLAKEFMRNFFGEPFVEGKKFDVLIREIVWAFRNPHVHAFYPFFRRKFGEKELFGGVNWWYFDFERRIGMTIQQLETDFELHKPALLIGEDPLVYVCPQILFVYFKRAIPVFANAVRHDTNVQKRFLENYRKLTPLYQLAA